MTAVVELKLLAAVLILLAGIAGCVFASRLSRSKHREVLASLANTFAGGVFLGAALMHMLPDAVEKFSDFAHDFEYPLFALVAACGFLLVLLLDKVLVPAGSDATSEMKTRGAIFPYVLMLTLSVHSVITGVALGLEDQLLSAVAIFLAVMAHKFTAATALAISFARQAIDKARSIPLLGIFCVMTPLGIILGVWWSSFLSGPGEAIVEGIFDALAAGTFFYIAVVDILSEEFSVQRGRWALFLMTVLGFAVMALVAIWT